MRIFAGVLSGRRSSTISVICNLPPTAEDILVTCALIFLRPICVDWPRLLTPFVATCVVDKNVVTRMWVKKRNVSYFSAKGRTFNSMIRSTMKSIIHHAKHIGLHSVVLCKISAFWRVADVYSADSVSQMMNLTYLTLLFCRDLCYYLIRKRCYRSKTARTPRCRCKLRCVPKFTAASHGPPCDSTASCKFTAWCPRESVNEYPISLLFFFD